MHTMSTATAKSQKKPKVRCTLSLDPDVEEMMGRRCEQEVRSTSNYVEWLIKQDALKHGAIPTAEAAA